MTFPVESFCFIFSRSASAGVFLLCLGISHDEFFLVGKGQSVQFVGEFCAKCFSQSRWNCDFPLLSIALKYCEI
jgi:hypothetical protein